MNYKVLMGYVTTYNCGDTFCDVICPMAFDARHTRTRQAIIEKIKHEVQSSVENHADERDLTIDHILNWRLNNFGATERTVPFNERNNYSLIECGFEEFWSGDLSYCYGIVEIEPEFFKSNESDVTAFTDYREVSKIIRVNNGERDQFGLSVKDMVWATVMTTLPEWDYDGRDDFNDTIKSLSKNLSAFFIHEKEDLPKIAEEFQRTYVPEEEVDFYIRDHVNWAEATKCVKNHGRMNLEFNCDLEARNDNGLFIGCRFQLIPVVTYYNVGDKECGEN